RLVNRNHLIGVYIVERLLRAARPFDRYGLDLRVLTEAKRQSEIGLRSVGRSAVDGPPLLAAGALDAHYGADAIAVGLRAHRADAKPLFFVTAIVAEQMGRAAVVGEQDVEVTIVVVVGVDGAARDQGRHELRADFGRHVLELPPAEVA